MRQAFYRPRTMSQGAAGNAGFHKTMRHRNKGHTPKTPLPILRAEELLAQRLEIIKQTEKISADFIAAAKEQLGHHVIALQDRDHLHPVIIAGMDNSRDMLTLMGICHQHHLPVLLVGRDDDANGHNNVTDLAANAAHMLELPGLQNGFVLLHFLEKHRPRLQGFEND